MEELTSRQRFLDACACKPVDRPPVWLMRQAGRALPEYRELKEKHSFLELTQTPSLAAEVTLQPIRRFGFDAAIIFSDILITAEAMGQHYRFAEQGGIEMAFTLESAEQIERLQIEGIEERLSYLDEALRLVRHELAGQTALLGFAGSPWTLACFMAEGGSSRQFVRAKEMFYGAPDVYERLADKLTEAVIRVLRLQIEAGVDAVQIFDSLGGLLAPEAYHEASGRWIRQIVDAVGDRVPVIVFPKGVHDPAELNRLGATVLGFDWTIRLAEMRRHLEDNVAVQGNLDPFLMTTTPEAVQRETRRILQSLAGQAGHIFNLGHGLPPNAKLENIEALVSTVREFCYIEG